MNQEQVFTIPEAAEYLNARISTLQKYCRDGQLPCAKIGKSYRIKKSDLDALFNRKQ